MINKNNWLDDAKVIFKLTRCKREDKYYYFDVIEDTPHLYCFGIINTEVRYYFLILKSSIKIYYTMYGTTKKQYYKSVYNMDYLLLELLILCNVKIGMINIADEILKMFIEFGWKFKTNKYGNILTKKFKSEPMYETSEPMYETLILIVNSNNCNINDSNYIIEYINNVPSFLKYLYDCEKVNIRNYKLKKLLSNGYN